MTSLQWVSTEMRTGKVIADLPDLDGGGSPITLLQTMGRYEQLTCSLPLPTAPENWQRAILEGASTLILLQDDVPVWGGFVNKSDRTEGDLVPMSLMTIEGWFDRIYLDDETFTAMGQNDIFVYLVNKYAVDGTLAGLPLRIQVTSGGAGKLRDRAYLHTDDKTLYAALQELAGVIDGPEWTIGLEHQSSPERYTLVLYVGDRVGNAVTPGMGPNATFDMPGGISTFDMSRDFGAGKGATSVIAVSTANGNVRPESPPQTVVDATRPRFEYRYTPSTSINDVNTLTGHASGKLGQLTGGTKSLTLTAIISDSPKFGTDWFMGDDIGYQIGGLDGNGKDTVPAFPGGISGVVRAIGVQVVLSDTPTISPVLAGSGL
jgi:hypothetical protein